MCVCVCASHFSCVRLFETLRTIAHQAPLSLGFSRQEYWSGLSCPPPGDPPDPGIKPLSLISPTLADGFFTASAAREAHRGMLLSQKKDEIMPSAATRVDAETIRQRQAYHLHVESRVYDTDSQL